MEIKTILNSFIDLIFPMRCLRCQQVIQAKQILCVNCSHRLALTHWSLSQNNPIFNQLVLLCKLQSAVALLRFRKNNTTRALLHEMKYRNRPQIGVQIAQLSTENLTHFNGLIIIPLHPKRLKQRGYNQLTLFAQELASLNQLPLMENYLTRIKYQSSQVQKKKNVRFKSLNEAFQLNKPLPQGHYLLVDDVVTTGATISSAVNTLTQQTNIKISVLTIAYAY